MRRAARVRAGPTNFGPTAEAATPWLTLALYLAARAGPPGVVLVAGQRLWRLPPQLAACSHALLWPWDLDALRAQARRPRAHAAPCRSAVSWGGARRRPEPARYAWRAHVADVRTLPIGGQR